MAITAYCKKCDREVEPGELCPYCGQKLGRNTSHTVWCVERKPVADWMCWNAVMRLLLPAALAVLLLTLLLETLSGGAGALERMLTSGSLTVLLILLGVLVAAVFLLLLLRGKDLMDCAVDGKGVHVTCYVPDPTPVRLLARLKSPSLMRRAEENGGSRVLKLETREILWKDVARVQLWPEKCTVLFYAPAWWLRVSVTCTPYSWDDTMLMIREKLGKKKQVRLPQELTVVPVKQPRRRTAARPAEERAERPAAEELMNDAPAEQLSMTDLMDGAPETPAPENEKTERD